MRFPLQYKLGLYAAVVSAIALMLLPTIMHRYIYHRQLAELDKELQDGADDLFKDLGERAATGIDPRKPLTRDFIQPSLRARLIRITARDGSELYRSTNWRNFDPRTLPIGQQIVVIQDTEGLDRNCRVVTESKGDFNVSIGTRLGTIEGMQEDLKFAFQVALPIVSLLVLVGTFLVARRVLRPIAAMTAAAERISVERPSERLPVPDTRDEIARLSRVLNASFDRLEKAYSAAERFSSAASHQFKTPLTVFRAGLSELRTCDYLHPTERETVESLLQQTRRLTTLCEDLLLLAKTDAGRLELLPEPLDLIPQIHRAIDDMEVLGLDNHITVQHELPDTLIALADPRRISIILQNLGDNAVKYNRPHGTIHITAREEKDTAIISVTSTGPCILPQDAERIFERFNRGKTNENVKGHGLGLNIARELARAHGGDLRLARSEATGTQFDLILPLVKNT